MTRDELVGAVADRTDIDPTAVDAAIRGLIDFLRDRMADGEITTISGFAKWTPLQRQARQIRNPRTGELTEVPDRFAVRVTPSPAFVKAAAG